MVSVKDSRAYRVVHGADRLDVLLAEQRSH
jgi:hypothetical protein